MSINTNLYYKVGVSFKLGMLSISSGARDGGDGHLCVALIDGARSASLRGVDEWRSLSVVAWR